MDAYESTSIFLPPMPPGKRQNLEKLLVRGSRLEQNLRSLEPRVYRTCEINNVKVPHMMRIQTMRLIGEACVLVGNTDILHIYCLDGRYQESLFTFATGLSDIRDIIVSDVSPASLTARYHYMVLIVWERLLDQDTWQVL